jgi:hypothetical protein
MVTVSLSFIVNGVKKSLILYASNYVVIYACTLKPYEILNIWEKSHFNAVCTIQVFLHLAPWIVTIEIYILFNVLSLPTPCWWHNIAQLLPARLAMSKFPAHTPFKSTPYSAVYISPILGHSYEKTVLSKFVSGLYV